METNNNSKDQVQPSVKQTLQALKTMQEKISAFENAPHEPIAIIGMGCKFPGNVNSPEDYWNLLKSGKNGIIEVPKDRWDADAYYDQNPDAPGKMNIKSGGFIKDVDLFDAGFFGIVPREAVSMDPQQRLLLEVCWETLENAGIVPEKLIESTTGVFIGMSQNDYAHIGASMLSIEDVDVYSATGAGFCFVSGRISYVLGLQGTCITLDTACSSSLVTIHMACQSLRSKECNLALAGGVQLMLSPEIGILLSKTRVLSSKGKCSTFSDDADGFVRGEGCGMIALKRLSDAEKDGDHILALIRGGAVNHDGKSSGFTAPNGRSQQAVIRQALADAKLKPEDISYIEAHGTGTPLGDPIEVDALGNVFNAGRAKEDSLLIGSVKTNFGHLEASAGIAGLMKVVLAMQHKQIPANLNYTSPNSYIPWDELSVKVVTELTEWKNNRRIAGISSFGMSGTNAHIIVEEAMPATKHNNTHAGIPSLLTLSAKSEKALEDLIMLYVKYFNENKNIDFSDVCFTANTCRSHFKYRLALIANSPTEASNELTKILNGSSPSPLGEGWGEGLKYLEGKEIDWVEFYKNVKHNKVNLPTYPFNRKSYWLHESASKLSSSTSNQFISNKNAHPLLGSRLKLANANQIIYQSNVSVNNPGYLKDHTVFKQRIFPGMGFLEMILSAGYAIFKSTHLKIENFSIINALTLNEKSQVLQTFVSHDKENTYSCKIYSCKAENEDQLNWILHAESTLKFNESTIAKSYGYSSNNPMGDFIPIDLLYNEFHKRGVKYGSTFALLKDVMKIEDGAIAHINFPENYLSDKYIFNPLLLDACTQVAGVVLPPTKRGVSYIPIGMDKFELYQTPISQVKICVIAKEEIDGVFRSDIFISDESGNAIGFIEGIRAKKVGEAFFKQENSENIEDWFYKVEWLQKDLMIEKSSPEYLCPTFVLKSYVEKTIPQLVNVNEITEYSKILPKFERLSIDFIINAFNKLNFQFHKSDSFTAQELIDRLKIAPAFHKLLNRLLEILQDENIIEPGNENNWHVINQPNLKNNFQAVFDQLMNEHPNAEAEIRLFFSCGANLAEVLIGEKDPLQCLFPNGDNTWITKLYQDSPVPRVMNLSIQKTVEKAVESLPKNRLLRILEIGAGTGSSTTYILPILPQLNTKYIFTDISPLFLSKAQENYKDYSFVEYKVLDIESDPSSQGFDKNQYDLIIAANVLHATTDIKQALKNVQNLLVPEGMLILLENTAQSRWIDLIFGLTEGWWRFTDHDVRPSHPLLFKKEWIKAISDIGLQSVECLSIAVNDSDYNLTQSVFLAKKCSVEKVVKATVDAYVIFAEEDNLSNNLSDLIKNKYESIRVYKSEKYQKINQNHYTLNPSDKSNFNQLLTDITNDHYSPIGFIHLWNINNLSLIKANIDTIYQNGCYSILHLLQSVGKHHNSIKPRLCIITRAAQPVNEILTENGLFQTPLLGMSKAIALEYPEVKCLRIDLDEEAQENEASLIIEEIESKNTNEGQLAFRNGMRYVARLNEADGTAITNSQIGKMANTNNNLKPEKELMIKANASYIITGGYGGLGLVIAKYLVNKGATKLILLGRSKPSEETNKYIEELRLHAVVNVVKADVTDKSALEKVIENIDKKHYPLKGIIHAAGILDDNILVNQTKEQFKRVLDSKVCGAWHLHNLTQNYKLDFFVLYSSSASLIGNPGQSNYAAANAFLDGLAYYRKSQGLPALSINWGIWNSVGLAVKKGADKEENRNQGVGVITPSQGIKAFEKVMDKDIAQIGIVPIDWHGVSLTGVLTEVDNFVLGIANKKIAKQNRNNQSTGNNSILNQIKKLDIDKQKPFYINYLRELAGKAMGLQASDIDPFKPMNQIGLDSLMAIELKTKVKSDICIDINVVRFMEGISIEELALELTTNFNNTKNSNAVVAEISDTNILVLS